MYRTEEQIAEVRKLLWDEREKLFEQEKIEVCKQFQERIEELFGTFNAFYPRIWISQTPDENGLYIKITSEMVVCKEAPYKPHSYLFI